MKENKKLEKNLGFSTALFTVIGLVIGSGIFFKPNAVFSATGAPGLGILTWIIAGIITIAAGLTCAEIAAAIPKTGGMVVYLKEVYGNVIGFLTGWMLSILYYPGLISALGVIFATNVVSFLGLNESMTSFIAISTILFIALVNTMGSKTSGAIQVISTICKLVPLLLIVVFGFIKGEGGSSNLMPMTNPDVSLASGLGTALLAVLFSYEGWLGAANLAGEMKNPKKDLPKAIILGISSVMLVYVAINIAYLWVLPADKLAVSTSPASDVATAIFGKTGGMLVTVGILISVFGTLNALLLTGPKALFVLAEEKQIPLNNLLSKISDKGVPNNAIWATALISCLFALTGSFDILTNITTFIVWVFYIMTFVAVIILRINKKDMERPYRVPLYPIVPIIAILGGLFVVLSTLFTQTSYALIGLCLTLLGLPIYFMMNKK